MNSLRFRLNLTMSIGLAVFFLLQWLIVSMAFQYLTKYYVETRLEHDIESLLLAINFTSEGVPLINAAAVNPTFNRAYSGHYYEITVNNVTLYSRSLWEHKLKLEPLKTGSSQKKELPGPAHQPLLVLSQSYNKQAHNLTISVAEDLSQLYKKMAELQLIYAIISVILFVLLLLLQIMVLKVSFRPLEKVREEMLLMRESKISNLNENVPGEVRPLVKEFNQLLLIMEKRLTNSRNALSNLAHALKLPLAVMVQMIEKLPSQQQRQTFIQQSNKIDIIIERELKKGRLAGASLINQKININEEISALIAVLKQVHQEKKLIIERIVPANSYFFGDREDLLELFGNLLDNAFKWANKKIIITIESEKELSFSIEDDGPACPLEDMDKLLKRGSRLDELKEGHGFGLAISMEIAELYHGKLTIGRSENLGGFKVRVEQMCQFSEHK